MLLNTFFFFLATQISYLSIIGLGTLLRNKSFENIWLDNFINFFIGLILINLLGQIFYYLNLNSEFLNLFIIIIGFYCFLIKGSKKTVLRVFLINIIFFSGLLISKLHEDWPYHFNYIQQISLNKPIIGIANLDDIHILSASFFSFAQRLFYLPIFEFKLVFIPVYLTYLNTVIFLIQSIFSSSKKLSQILLIILTILAVKLARISEFGYDYISNIILLKIVILYLTNEFDKQRTVGDIKLGKDPETGVTILDEDPQWVWIREDASGAYIELRLDKEYGYIINIVQGEFEMYDFELGGQDNEINIEQIQ